MAAGADLIDDLGLPRHGAAVTLFAGVRARYQSEGEAGKLKCEDNK